MADLPGDAALTGQFIRAENLALAAPCRLLQGDGARPEPAHPFDEAPASVPS